MALTPRELRRWRMRLLLSQADLARRCHRHPMTVSKWERGIQRIDAVVEEVLRLIEREQQEVEQAEQAEQAV